MQNIYDLTYEELKSQIISWGFPAYRTDQVWEGLYHKYWHLPDQFSALPKAFRSQLSTYFSTPEIAGSLSQLQPEQTIQPPDGETIKTLFSLVDQRAIEAVLMRYEKRRTLCISTQAGCAMGCVFCATGQMGFRRHLTSGEIVEQVLHYARQLAEKSEQVTNIVFMGMGEPFHNYDETMAAIDRLNYPQGYNFGARRMTISTVGIIPGLNRFTKEHRQINLAVSLHAADEELRSKLLPINQKYPLRDLFPACVNYVKETHRRISFEWALIQEVNDTLEQARLLADRLKVFKLGDSMLCHVNVIRLNPTLKYAKQATTRQRVDAFVAELTKHGVPCTIRLRRGIDIQAGCGQLWQRHETTS